MWGQSPSRSDVVDASRMVFWRRGFNKYDPTLMRVLASVLDLSVLLANDAETMSSKKPIRGRGKTSRCWPDI